MRLIIAGGRDFTNAEAAFSYIRAWSGIFRNWKSEEVEIVCGGATGADAIGREYARRKGLTVMVFKPDWNEHGKAAGPIRNAQMAEYGTHLLAFWDGESRGTGSMIRQALDRGLPVAVCFYDANQNITGVQIR